MLQVYQVRAKGDRVMQKCVMNSVGIILSSIFFFLISCASTGRKQSEFGDAEYYNDWGIAYEIRGQYDQAIADFTNALEINPKYVDAYINRGIAHANKGEYDQAISDYTKALEIDPKGKDVYYNRGVAYYFKRTYDKSLENIEKAQELGYPIPLDFLDKLRKASGRGK